MERNYEVFFPHQVKRYLYRYQLNTKGVIAEETLLWTKDRKCDECLFSGSVTCFALDPTKFRCDDCFLHIVEDLVIRLNFKYGPLLTHPIVYWRSDKHSRYGWVRADQGISILSDTWLSLDDLKEVKVTFIRKPIVQPFSTAWY